MTPGNRLLLVEDDPELQSLVSGFLAREGFDVAVAGDGREADRALAASPPDLVILDLMLPGEDGLSICRRLRQATDLPILMLTAKSEDIDRIVGLEVGADDYLGKPFNPRELLARIRAILRRAGRGRADKDDGAAPAPGRVLSFDGWRLALDARQATGPDGREVELTTGEFDLLAVFAGHARRVLSRDQLLEMTQGRSHEPFDRSIDVQVSRLRKKVGADLIRTVRNTGYLFTAEVRKG